MESWRLVWRQGLAPVLPTRGLEALLGALERDDPQLTQGQTTLPPPSMAVQDWPCAAADAIGFAVWKGDARTSIGEVEEGFAKACFDCDQRMGQGAACGYFLNFWDHTPRAEAFDQLANEVRLVLMARSNVKAAMGGIECPEGFVQRLLDADPAVGDAATLGALADWLDEHDHPTQAEICRAAHYLILEETSRAHN